jgi:hypothetical protein
MGKAQADASAAAVLPHYNMWDPERERAKWRVNGCDDAMPTSHQAQVFDAIGHQDKERVDLPEANHYFTGEDRRSHLSRADHVHDWLRRHGFNVN